MESAPNRRYASPAKQFRRIGPTRRSVSGVYAFRGEMPVPFESTLERDFLIRAEFFRSVVGITAQPVEVPYLAADGNRRTYTPDYLVYHRLEDCDYARYPKPQLVEVKPEKQWRAHWREWLLKWKAAWRYARDEGWTFHVHDESRIRDGVLANVRFLERYARMNFDEQENRRVLETIGQMGSAPVHYIVSSLFPDAHVRRSTAHLWHLLAKRRLDCDIGRPLDEFTELWSDGDEP